MREQELNRSDVAAAEERAEAPADEAEASRATIALSRLALLVAVTLSGASVMVYEFIAIRVLQRYFGGRLDVWASEIAVVMAGLALGYFFGGRMADRYRSTKLLGAGIAIAGVLGALILPLAEFAGEQLIEVDVGLRWHPLIAAFASSFVPFLTLGAVLPQVIRLYVSSFASVGTAAGNIAALSTVGSIAGVLATGMYLLTYFGVRETLYATSAVLIVTGVMVAAIPARKLAAAAFAGLVLLLPISAKAEILFEDYSAYHHIMVEDQGGTRILWFDNQPESLMAISDPDSGGFEYADFFHVPMLLDPTTKRVLFVGLGGGTGPKSFLKEYPGVTVDVVEIDPMVVKVAHRYFELPRHGRLNVSVADGRAYLQRHGQRYGAIMMDAYSTGPYGGVLPYHLATREFFQLVRKRLVNGGCVVYNVISTFGNGSVLQDVYRTMREVFPAVYAFQASTSANVVLVGQKINYETLHPTGTREGRGWPDDPWLAHPLSTGEFQNLAYTLIAQERPLLERLPQRLGQTARISPYGRVLTDEYAPTDTAPRRRR